MQTLPNIPQQIVAGDVPYYAFHRLANRCSPLFAPDQPDSTYLYGLVHGVYERAAHTSIEEEWHRLAQDRRLRSAINTLPVGERWLAQLELRILITEHRLEQSASWPRYACYGAVWITILLHVMGLLIYGWSWLPQEPITWALLVIGVNASVWIVVWLYRLALGRWLMKAYATLKTQPLPNEQRPV